MYDDASPRVISFGVVVYDKLLEYEHTRTPLPLPLPLPVLDLAIVISQGSFSLCAPTASTRRDSRTLWKLDFRGSFAFYPC